MITSQFAITNSPFTILIIGIALAVIGWLHQIPSVEFWDARTFEFLHHRLSRYAGFFRYIWPLGTTPVTVILIALVFVTSSRAGWLASGAYLIAAVIERTIKMSVKRARPFETLSNVNIQQPSRPHDPSYPSGDALRVWFLAILIPAVFGLSWPVYVATGLIATTLSLGRIALGVHYPLDVLGGTGLGLIATSATVISLQSSVFML